MIATCDGDVRICPELLSLFRTEAACILPTVHLISSVAKEFKSKIRVSWSLDIEVMVRRVQKMIEYNLVVANTKNKHGPYCGTLEVLEVCHVCGQCRQNA